MMWKFLLTVTTFAALTAGGFGFTGTASADDTAPLTEQTSAADCDTTTTMYVRGMQFLSPGDARIGNDDFQQNTPSGVLRDGHIGDADVANSSESPLTLSREC